MNTHKKTSIHNPQKDEEEHENKIKTNKNNKYQHAFSTNTTLGQQSYMDEETKEESLPMTYSPQSK